MANTGMSAQNPSQGIRLAGQTGKKRFVIAQRQPWDLPRDEVKLPPPGTSIGPPPTFNLITSVLPPLLMMGGSLIYSLVSNTGGLKTMIPMLIMSMGFPLASAIGLWYQKRDYHRKVAARENDYRVKLKSSKEQIQKLSQEQRDVLEQEYPALPKLTRIALEQGQHPRLWCRRPRDLDFLSLRYGVCPGKPTFSIAPPQYPDQTDKLFLLATEVSKNLQTIQKLPALLDLPRVGSIAITGRQADATYSTARRILLDILVHHSPEDVRVVCISDGPSAEAQWEWLKWAPHSRAFSPEVSPKYLAFTEPSIGASLHWLSDEFNDRRGRESSPGQKGPIGSAIVVFMDDQGIARSTPDIARIAESGHTCGIYLVFVGGRNWPRECRARLDLLEGNTFRYSETWAGEGDRELKEGLVESAEMADCERIVRSLAGLELAGGSSSASLPDSIRISQVLGCSRLDNQTIPQQWSKQLAPRDLLQFPVGVQIGRTGLEPILVDLRPEDMGGKQAFHTVLIGTTGSGKSVFLQSLVLSAAYNYSPKEMNFLLMDFKAGASELSKLKELPHVVGLVTDLGPEMASRALVALESEIQRRKQIFEKAGKISDIWAYNKRYPDAYIPHLLLVLDEFAKGIEILPEMQKVLQTLATQGRALGMYLLLANQKVTSAVDMLLSNIGWRILLRVSERDEMRIVDPNRPPANRPGRGYIRVKEEVTEFQGSRADQMVIASSEEVTSEYKLYRIAADGSRSVFFTYAGDAAPVQKGETAKLSELETLIHLMKEASKEMGYAPARPIYLDPLPGQILLKEVFSESNIPVAFDENTWVKDRSGSDQLIAPIGFLDHPEECVQDCFSVDFKKQDGHLWIVGAPGSGKAMALSTLLFSLALTHTPEEIQFYILEYGAGTLRPFERLPHTGAVIRLPEKERLERLLNYLDAEMERRTAEMGGDGTDTKNRWPSLFLVINNFAELRTNYSDFADRISRYVRDGKAAGLHLIIATNRGMELSRMVSSNIAQRLILQLASRDEYMDLLGRFIQTLSGNSEGRGYFSCNGIAECQVAHLTLEGQEGYNLAEVALKMKTSWQGNIPRLIQTLDAKISLQEVLDKTASLPTPAKGLRIPIGIVYENLQVLSPDLLDEIPNWLVIGPRQSGKSNFLGSMAVGLLSNEKAVNWEVKIFLFRRSPLTELVASNQRIQLFNSAESVLQELQNFTNALAPQTTGPSEKQYLLLVDDLGAAFEPGKETILAALNALASKCGTRTDVVLAATGIIDELRTQLASPIMRLLRQSRTGVGFSKESTELEWLGVQIPLSYRKMDLPPGRGFWASKGKAIFLQTLWCGDPSSDSISASGKGAI